MKENEISKQRTFDDLSKHFNVEWEMYTTNGVYVYIGCRFIREQVTRRTIVGT